MRRRATSFDTTDNWFISKICTYGRVPSIDLFFARVSTLAPRDEDRLQDYVRTSGYRDAILKNRKDFEGKVVMDVGTGSGILAFFAAQAGAKRVYAVEASEVAKHARTLVEKNGFSNIIKIVKGKVEDVEIPEKVDIIISEPMGFMLIHERMLESYVEARNRFLKPGGKMFPSIGTIYMTPFTDAALYNEQIQKVTFWENKNFYGVDLSSLREQALADHFAQPVVGYFDPRITLCSKPVTHVIDFGKVTLKEMRDIRVSFQFKIERTALMHGIAAWFDVDFVGSTVTHRLDTGPHSQGTHWYQCRLLMQAPLAVNKTQVVTGTVDMKANNCQSFNIQIATKLDKTSITSEAKIRLQDQFYHYMQVPQQQSTHASYDAAAYDAHAQGDGQDPYASGENGTHSTYAAWQ